MLHTKQWQVRARHTQKLRESMQTMLPKKLFVSILATDRPARPLPITMMGARESWTTFIAHTTGDAARRSSADVGV